MSSLVLFLFKMPSWQRWRWRPLGSCHLKLPLFSTLLSLLISLSPKSHLLVANCAYFQNRANLTLNNTSGRLLEQLPLSAVFTSSSAYQQAYGRAVSVLSNSTTTTDAVSSLDNFGCSKYVNSNLPTSNFVAIVSVNSICSVDDQIKIAYESGAQALIVRNNISDTPTLTTKLQGK